MSQILEQIAKKQNTNLLTNNQQNVLSGEKQFQPSPLAMTQSQVQAKKEWQQQYGFDFSQLPSLQKQEMPEEEEEVQMKSLSDSALQKQEMSEEEEEN